MKDNCEVIEKSKTNRTIYFDILNIAAIIAVVAMHCNEIVHKNPLISAWNTSLFIDCIFYWAVPVFFMLTGATLMTYRQRYDTKTFFKKRFLKVLLPFAFWAIIVFLWKIYIQELFIDKTFSIVDLINIILTNQEEYIYYFMFEILGVYLTMPLLSLLAKDENRNTLWLTVILYFIFNAIFADVLPQIGIEYNMSFTVQIGGYIVYVLLGYLLSTQDLTKNQKSILYISAILGVIYRYCTTFVLSKQSGIVIKLTWGYCSWHCILLACAVFVFVKGLKINKKFENSSKIQKALAEIASCTFGIYLMHKIIIYYQILLLDIDNSTIEWRTIGIISTYFISLAIVFILKKIPVIKKLVP